MAIDPKLSAALAALKANPELAERVLMLAEPQGKNRVLAVRDAMLWARGSLAGLDHERLAVLALNRMNAVIDSTHLTTGTDGFCIVDPKQVLRWVLTRKRAAHSFVLAHNHPSGDPTPSAQDNSVTERVARAAQAVGLRMLDHIVVGAESEYSYAENGLLPVWETNQLFCT